MSDYLSLIDDLQQCRKGTEEEFSLYQKIVDFCESKKEIEELKEILNTDVIDHSKGALSLLEKALPIYRTLEIRNPEYTTRRFYAMKKMVECLYKLGNEKLALVYEYELKYLQRDVLDMRKNNS